MLTAHPKVVFNPLKHLYWKLFIKGRKYFLGGLSYFSKCIARRKLRQSKRYDGRKWGRVTASFFNAQFLSQLEIKTNKKPPSVLAFCYYCSCKFFLSRTVTEWHAARPDKTLTCTHRTTVHCPVVLFFAISCRKKTEGRQRHLTQPQLRCVGTSFGQKMGPLCSKLASASFS